MMRNRILKKFPELRILKDVHENEDGMIAWALLVAILFLMCFSGLVYNAGSTVNRKLETQNAADSSAYSGSLWIARGMNAMTASNHLIGELNALYILHHSLAGRWLDDEGREENDLPESQAANIGIEIAYGLAQSSQPIPVLSLHKDKLTEHPHADANSMIFEAKIQLKIIMATTYGVHAAGAALTLFPLTYAAGVAVEAAAFAVEWKVYQEYLVLDGLEMVANITRSAKKAIPGVIHRLLYQGYQQGALIVNMPRLAVNAAESVAEKQGAKGVIHGDFPDSFPSSLMDAVGQAARVFPLLPVEKEVTDDEKRSQMMRATYPWVAKWREPINKFLLWTCTFSGAKAKYTKWTNRYALQTCTWLRKDSSETYKIDLTVQNYNTSGSSGNGEKGKEIHLFVVKGMKDTPNGIGKSQEAWNNWNERGNASTEIEKHFCHVGFASKTPPRIGVARFYRQENPNGLICFAQSMVYNANPQQHPKGPGPLGGSQPQVGWDTLNWVSGAKEYPSNVRDEIKCSPQIKLNWQAKLTPVTPQKLIRVLPKAVIDSNARAILAATREGLILTSH